MSEAGSRLSRMSYDGFAVPFLVKPWTSLSYGLERPTLIKGVFRYGRNTELLKRDVVSEAGLRLSCMSYDGFAVPWTSLS